MSTLQPRSNSASLGASAGLALPLDTVDVAPEQGTLSAPAGLTASRWGALSVRERLAWVKRFRGVLVANADAVCELVCQETGKPAWEAFSGDLLPLLSACRWHERFARRHLEPRAATGRPFWMLGQKHSQQRAPLGRVAIIATWNYPVQLLGVQMLQALVCGNDVVVKPSERTPRTQRYLVQLARQAGLPEGTLTLRDHAREAGQQMLESERFDHIVFTGSTRVGGCIARLAAETLTPTTLELSGCDSALVLEDADVSLAARCIWNALIMNAGQTCLAPRRLLVDARVYPAFLAALAPLAAGAKPLVMTDRASAERTFSLALRSIDSGGRSLSGVLEPPSNAAIRPLAIVDCPASAPLATEEHFGCALAVVACSSLDEMLAIHGRIGQKLSTSVFTRRPSAVSTFASRLGSSCVTINDVVLPCSHPGTSIAGLGASGWGASRGVDGLLALSRPITMSSTSAAMRLPPEPPEPAIAERIKRTMLWWYRVKSTLAVKTPPENRHP